MACRPARKMRQQRERRAWLVGTLLPGTERWGAPDTVAVAARRARERAHALRYYHALPEDRRSALVAKWTEKDRCDYERTRRAAGRHRDTWTEDDDRYILSHLTTAAREVGLALGRTTWAVRQRRWRLRWHCPTAGEPGEDERASGKGMTEG